MKLRTKIIWLCATTLVGILIIAMVSLTTLRRTMMEEREAQLSLLVTLAKAAAEKAQALEQSGKLTREQAQAQAKLVIGSFVKEQNYYFVRGYTDDFNYVHPNPKRVGIQDKTAKEDGDRYRAALQGKEIGLLIAEGTRPNTTEKVQKLYAVTRFAPWDWTIGFGAYIDDINQAFYRNALVLLLLGGVLMGAIATMAAFILRSILRQLGGEPARAVQIVEQIAQGDLSTAVALKANDRHSLLHSIETMRRSLSGIVQGVRQGTDTIATASGEIAAGNLDLSSRTEQQASALEETASSMEELTSIVRQNADNASQANQLAITASGVATNGGKVIEQVVGTMADINSASTKIADIIGVIDGIAFQTNILALNAAVEAARAGEQGRGFAVVASEVRSLAQRSAQAAREIKGLIEDSVSKVDNGSQLVEQAGRTMQEIVTSVRHVTDVVAEISAASREQSAGIEEVNRAITQMDQVTQQNAALVEEAAAAAASMQDQAAQLAQLVSVFRLQDAAQGLR
ncbi:MULTISPECIES: methyl-accepting chemotaxis protein [Herbaspirillum]|uniref:Methyl-accepting chemotaxis protein n=3 Tax=Herbaspirillum huttiense TaxID=863372 RepID=A0AAJ2HE42_9BURK|nr:MULTISPECIES: methyl-accepting chemotaxis protein [Herbaspirillum]MDR6739988.1 methyl-accepting chemotaxis protein [Herbaspirillum sp. 1173]MDR9838360.1 methyl-accepting chemotaxis protein [Herbaspirillum huttiense]MDR9848319.1 methyl-accepting chemotaxis protein [Herbaspirillum huttiense SE1]UWE15187.1 methyl-accepting chemotaxis protein [Herbaspirillum huttiense]